MVPVTRMKGKNVERNPKFWDKQFPDDFPEDGKGEGRKE